MNKDNSENSKSDQEKLNKPSNDTIKIPITLLSQIHAFIALSNNVLMSIPVCGDQILDSAKVMNMANDLHKELKDLKNG